MEKSSYYNHVLERNTSTMALSTSSKPTHYSLQQLVQEVSQKYTAMHGVAVNLKKDFSSVRHQASQSNSHNKELHISAKYIIIV